jgi:hypothetical protein
MSISPTQIETFVHQASLEVQRRLFGALIEKADQELVLSRRHGKGGDGIQRRGTRPFTFKTIFGEATRAHPEGRLSSTTGAPTGERSDVLINRSVRRRSISLAAPKMSRPKLVWDSENEDMAEPR